MNFKSLSDLGFSLQCGAAYQNVIQLNICCSTLHDYTHLNVFDAVRVNIDQVML